MTHTRKIRLFASAVLAMLLVAVMPFGVFAEEVPVENAVVTEDAVPAEEAAAEEAPVEEAAPAEDAEEAEEADPLAEADAFIESYSDNVENTDEFTQNLNEALAVKRTDVKTYATIWALLPPVIAIVLALITKEVYSSLFIGI